MILKKVKITNYRQLQNVELDMQDSLTVLAGPNNSGIFIWRSDATDI